MADGNDYGIYLSPEETSLFPAVSVFPLFKRNGDVTAYQVGVDICPNLQADGKCGIYETRPLVCRTYPVHDRTILRSDCVFISEHQGEGINVNSLSAELESFREQERQAMSTPRNEWKWPLNLRRWVEV